MATDKLVDFDHVTDYISREAAIAKFCDDCIDKKWCKRNGGSCSKIKNINAVPAADVRTVAEIDDAVYDAMYYLNSVSSQMPYHVYSALFDLICGIFKTCGADMREPNLDTTKGDSHD